MVPFGRQRNEPHGNLPCGSIVFLFPDMMSDPGATVCTHKVTCSNAGSIREYP